MTDGPSFADRTMVVSGGSRGIGLAIALGAARRGANMVLLAKTAEPHPKLPGTVHTAAAEIEEAGIAFNCLCPDVHRDRRRPGGHRGRVRVRRRTRSDHGHLRRQMMAATKGELV